MNSTYPEKVLQFGTGILLRGLPDYFIDKANGKSIFNGSIVVVKSTEGPVEDFEKYGNTYAICVRGIQKGRLVEENIINHALSRVLSAKEHWSDVLRLASSPDLSVILSNTTEVGIQYEPESIFKIPPSTYPAKLAAVLYERFRKLGKRSPDLVVVPTELIPDNGKLLKEIVIKLAHYNRVDPGFHSWLDAKAIFCNSLVDRIVTRPSTVVKESWPEYNSLTIQAEPYKLWAIEGNDRARKTLSFAEADPDVIIAVSIERYRERKLRIVNGGGTVTANVGFLRGLNTFYECMADKKMMTYVNDVVLNEIEPTLPDTTRADTRQFAAEVLERWRNTFTVHHLLSITLQGTAKTKMRNVPTFFRYAAKFNTLPRLLLDGFAAHLFFMRAVQREGKNYFGLRHGELYPIQDDRAEFFYHAWTGVNPEDKDSLKAFVHSISQDTGLWGADLTTLPGFVEKVTERLAGWARSH